MLVHPNGKLLYAVNKVGDYQGQKAGAVSAFAIEPSGKLRLPYLDGMAANDTAAPA